MKKFGGQGKKKQCCELRKCKKQSLNPTSEISIPTKKSEKYTQADGGIVIAHNNKRKKSEGSSIMASKQSNSLNMHQPKNIVDRTSTASLEVL